MLDFLAQNGGDLIVGGILLIIVLSILLKIRKDKKTGKSSCGCGGGCSGCGNSDICHINPDDLKQKLQ
ncbi:FeoB-associated Cys-rich membrane protein [Eubacteriales bacterium KG127]